MRVINKIVAAQLKKNSKRSITTVFGIAVSVAMLTSVVVCFRAAFGFAKDFTVLTSGTWNAEFFNVKKENIADLTGDADLKCYAVEKYWRVTAANCPGEEAGKPKVSDNKYMLKSFSKCAQEMNLLGKLSVGHWPQNTDEIVLPLGIRGYKPGDRISVTYEGSDSGTEWQKSKVFVVTGLMDSGYSWSHDLVSLLDEESLEATDQVNVYLRFNNFSWNKAKQLQRQSEQLGMGIRQNFCYNIDSALAERELWTDVLLKRENLPGLRGGMLMILSLGAFLICVIIGAAVGMIYGAFSLSLSERSKYLGIISSVGATRWQKVRSMFFEVFALGSLGTALGLVAGFAGIGLTFYLIRPLIITIVELPIYLKFNVSGSLVMMVVLLSAIALLISALIPAFKSFRVTAMDAIRQTKDVKLTRRKVKTSKLARKIFGMQGELALKNLKRNKSKYRVILLSLSSNLIVFVVASAFVKSLYVPSALKLQKNAADITASVNVSHYNESKSGWGAEELEKILQAKKEILQESSDIESLPDNINCLVDGSVTTEGQDEIVTFSVYAYNDEQELSKILERNDLNVKPSDLVMGDMPVFVVGEDRTIGEKELLPGVKIVDASQESGEKQEKNWAPYYCTIESLKKFLAQNKAAEVRRLKYNFEFKVSKDDGRAEKAISEALESLEGRIDSGEAESVVENVKKVAKKVRSTTIIILVFALGFYSLILLICITNVFNTMSTNVILRKREFAVLKSVGLDDKGINKILDYETLFYGAKTLLLGIPLGALLVLLLTAYDLPKGSLKEAASYLWKAAAANLPWYSMAVASVMVFIIIKIPMRYAKKELKKDSIINAIKKESI